MTLSAAQIIRDLHAINARAFKDSTESDVIGYIRRVLDVIVQPAIGGTSNITEGAILYGSAAGAPTSNASVLKLLSAVLTLTGSAIITAGLEISGGNLTMDGGTGTCSSDAVTINKPTGVITTESKSTAAAGNYVITLTNSVIEAADVVLVQPTNGGAGEAVVTNVTPGSGSCTIEVTNLHASAAFDSAHKLMFLVIKQ